MIDDDVRNIDPVREAMMYQESLDLEDREQERLENEIWPEEIIVILVVFLLFGALAYFLL